MTVAIQSDYDFIDMAGSGTYSGGSDGRSELHTNLSNPLTGEGVFCREYAIATPGVNSGVLAALKSAFDGGSFFGVPSTKKLSVRAWLRIGTPSTTDFHDGSMGISIKTQIIDNARRISGYSAVIGEIDGVGNSASLALRLVTNNGSAVSFPAFPDIIPSFIILKDVWYKIRLDVTPTGTTSDLIELFTGTGVTGGEIWTLRASRTLLNSDDPYVAWGGARRTGYYCLDEGTTNTLHNLIDRYRALRAPA